MAIEAYINCCFFPKGCVYIGKVENRSTYLKKAGHKLYAL